MKKISLFLAFFSLLAISVYGQEAINHCSIRFSKNSDSVIVDLSVKANEVLWPRFTPGNHEIDTSLTFSFLDSSNGRSSWTAALPRYQRGGGSGKFNNGPTIYDLGSGPISTTGQFFLTIDVPTSKHLLFHGEIFGEPSRVPRILLRGFSNYFTAREFPLVLLDSGKYLVRYSKLNGDDSLKVIFTWTDSLGESKLPMAFAAVDSAARKIGSLAPNYWHKHIGNFDDATFSYLYIINSERVVTGLESSSAPYSIMTPQSISEEASVHTLFHTFDRYCLPKSYLEADGHFHPSDALWFYEGLTTFLSQKFSSPNGELADFINRLTPSLYRGKLAADIVDTRKLSQDERFESWYAKGFLFFLFLQEKADFNPEGFVTFLFDNKLIDSGRVAIESANVLNWISEFNPAAGRLVQEYGSGAYLKEAWKILLDNGWSPAPLSETPRWFQYYLGPYPIKQPGVQLPTDNYPLIPGYPKYLVMSDGSKKAIEATENNEALKLFKSQPDYAWTIEFSSGERLKIKDNFSFSDGSSYFMFGKIKADLSPSQKTFWRKLDYYLK